MIAVHRRNFIEEPSIHSAKQASKTSVSTEGSDSPRQAEVKKPYKNKEKLQLCKKFTEFGYCPYGGKCKFAHGYHELRKNNSTNCKYKTKECVTFIKDGFCHYGSRCNFVHSEEAAVMERNWEAASGNYREVFYFEKNQSRVLRMLQKK